MVPGILIYQLWNGGITRCGLDETLNERPGWTLLALWPCSQRRQVTYDDVPNRHTMVGDV